MFEAEIARDGVHAQTQSELAELSNAMVRLYKENFGRGPTRARSDYADPNTLVTTLEDTLTPVERTMRELGEHQRLEEIRLFFQKAMRDEFISAVEQITRRKVRGFVSGMDAREDIATEVFYLEPTR
jgi:uncharacterized protein YbcI